jgi:hypothetical protein
MIAVLITMVMLLAVAGALHTGVIAETQLRGSHVRSLAGFYAAEAGINRGMGDYRNIFQSYQYPTGSDLAEKAFALGARTVRYQLTPVTVNAMVTVGAGQPFAGLSAIRNSYTAASRSELAGDVEARIGTQFDVDSIPLFQFLAFYANDLEILPGANMNLHGPIHTNGMLYLNSNATLTIEDCYPAACPTAIRTVQITSAGTVFRGRKDTTECLGTVRVSRLTDQNNNGILDLQDMPCSGTQTSAQLSTWLGSIRANVPALVVPAPDVISRGAGPLLEQRRSPHRARPVQPERRALSDHRAGAGRDEGRREDRPPAAVHDRQAGAHLLQRRAQRRERRGRRVHGE